MGSLTDLDDRNGDGNFDDGIHFKEPRYLGIKIGVKSNQEMVPRHQIVPSFHARAADVAFDAQKLNGRPPTDYIIPPGAVLSYAGATAPPGYYECNGRALDQRTDPGLFAALGTRYGSVNGDSFRLPDYRGYFLRGWDHGARNDPGAGNRTNSGDGTTGDRVGTRQEDQVIEHKHNDKGHTHSYVTGHATKNYDAKNEEWEPLYNRHNETSGTGNANLGDAVRLDNGAVRTGNENRPKNINVMYICKK